MTELFIDLETRATVDLRTSNPYRYAEDPRFSIMMAAWSLDGEPVGLALGREAIGDIPGLWDPKVKKIAHNAQFERVCLSRFRGLPTGKYLPIQEWHDTQAIAGVQGYPQKLGKLARWLGGEQKDEAGTRLINLFCKPNRKGEWNGPDTHPEEWFDFCMYGVQDVYTLIDVHRKLGGFPTEIERAIYWADQAVNDAGLTIDVPMARDAQAAAADNFRDQLAEMIKITELENPNSNPQLLGWLQTQGVTVDGKPITNLQKETVEEALKGDLTPEEHRVLELRQEMALVASKKFTAALNSVSSDGQLRGSFRYFRAHTGRWAGSGAQPQNLPREAFTRKDPITGKKEHDPDAENAAIAKLEMGMGASALDLKRLVRSMFLGPMTVVDYSAIEARVISWLAGEDWALEAFRADRDIYVETAERMGGLERSQGKVAVLALGFGGSANSLKVMAGDAVYVDKTGNEVRAGTTGTAVEDGKDGEFARLIRDMPDDELRVRFVYPWRKANQQIVRLWNDLEAAIPRGGTVGEHLRVVRTNDGKMKIHLPSGRAIHYHDVKFGKYRKPIGGGKFEWTKGWHFLDPRYGTRTGTYGGKLAENVTQAVARDIMAEAIVRLQNNGLTVTGHVHDEILVAGRHQDRVEELMKVLPSWAPDLPIDAKGFTTPRYRKD